jgi:hypothetical protein
MVFEVDTMVKNDRLKNTMTKKITEILFDILDMSEVRKYILDEIEREVWSEESWNVARGTISSIIIRAGLVEDLLR